MYSTVCFLKTPSFMVSLGFQISNLLYPSDVFILSCFTFGLSLAKSWSGNPKLQTRKHKLTFSEPVVLSSSFREALPFQT